MSENTFLLGADRRERIKQVLATIETDAEADALALDGKPFTGRTMAELFGETYAAIEALARVNAYLLEQIENLERRP